MKADAIDCLDESARRPEHRAIGDEMFDHAMDFEQRGHGLPASHPVIAGLDRAIHPLRKTFAKKMDTRVKPAYDELI
jgi:hypothetical protein